MIQQLNDSTVEWFTIRSSVESFNKSFCVESFHETFFVESFFSVFSTIFAKLVESFNETSFGGIIQRIFFVEWFHQNYLRWMIPRFFRWMIPPKLLPLIHFLVVSFNRSNSVVSFGNICDLFAFATNWQNIFRKSSNISWVVGFQSVQKHFLLNNEKVSFIFRSDSLRSNFTSNMHAAFMLLKHLSPCWCNVLYSAFPFKSSSGPSVNKVNVTRRNGVNACEPSQKQDW